ncbi:MAG: hypothetical protein ACLFWB_02955 [Armatimonadota bacterium]
MVAINKGPEPDQLRKRYLAIAAIVVVGFAGAFLLARTLSEAGRVDLALTVVIALGVIIFGAVGYIFRDFFEPILPTKADEEITGSEFSDALEEIAREKKQGNDD